MNVHPFGATSSPFCANFALRRTVEDNQTSFSPSLAVVVKDNFYVDDCLFSVQIIKEAKLLVKDLGDMLKRGGFHLTKWLSNCLEVVPDLPNNAVRTTKADVELQTANQRALGVRWYVPDDCFTFNLHPPTPIYTKQSVMSFVASLYDPLGIVASLLLPTLRLFQDLS
ncbi:hypothetical protein, partial [Streptococcus dysgalactiae]|uniref:hypothetical protein n=1 Tax=Streptococcus dysgalactiae TaxID=1334 RepID=UPI00195286B8